VRNGVLPFLSPLLRSAPKFLNNLQMTTAAGSEQERPAIGRGIVNVALTLLKEHLDDGEMADVASAERPRLSHRNQTKKHCTV
jgi:hypothetical protein